MCKLNIQQVIGVSHKGDQHVSHNRDRWATKGTWRTCHIML